MHGTIQGQSSTCNAAFLAWLLLSKLIPGLCHQALVGESYTSCAEKSASFGYTDGTGTYALFNVPGGMIMDTSGNIFIADYCNNEIRMITPTAVVMTIAGNVTSNYADGPGRSASFNKPYGLGIDTSSNVYVADCSNNAIRKMTPAGIETSSCEMTK